MGRRGEAAAQGRPNKLLLAARFHSVHQLIKRKKFAQALRELLSSQAGKLADRFAKEPNHAWYLVGDIYWKQDKVSLAAAAFKRSIAADSSDGEAFLALGNCYSDLGQHRKALKAYSEGLHAAPRNAKLRFNLGNAHFDLGQYEQAVAMYRSVRRSKDETVRQRAAVNLKLAMAKLAVPSFKGTNRFAVRRKT